VADALLAAFFAASVAVSLAASLAAFLAALALEFSSSALPDIRDESTDLNSIPFGNPGIQRAVPVLPSAVGAQQNATGDSGVRLREPRPLPAIVLDNSAASRRG